MLFHDTIANAESQSHSLPNILGSKKRVEDFVKVFSRNPLAVVPYNDQALAVFLETRNPNGRFHFRRGISF
jgi:hypothetical protein